MSEKNNPSAILAGVTLFLFIISFGLFFLDRPYWYFGIITFVIAIMIVIVKAIWRIAGWADDVVQKATSKDPKIDVTYKIDLDDNNVTEKQEKKENEK